MSTKQDFDFEEYRDQLPQLERGVKFNNLLALMWGGAGAVNAAAFAFGHSWVSFAFAGLLLTGATMQAVAKKTKQRQIELITGGEKPLGVTERLSKKRKPAPKSELDMVEELEKYRAEGEKAALDEKHQWWRQPGSSWWDAKETIDRIGHELRQIELEELKVKAAKIAKDAAEIKMLAERERAKLIARLEIQRLADQQAELKRKAAATRKWAELNKARIEREEARKIEGEREWDAFTEDAQVDARKRKEAGDWYEPPEGMPDRVGDERRYNKRFSGGGWIDRDFGAHQEHAMRQIEQTLGLPANTINGSPYFTPAKGVPVCPAGRQPSYTFVQADTILAALRGAGDRRTSIYPCARDELNQVHYHLVKM